MRERFLLDRVSGKVAVLARGGDEHARLRELSGRALPDAGPTQELVRQPDPAAAPDDNRLVSAGCDRSLARDTPVPDAHDTVRDRGRLRIVANDQRGRPMLARQLSDQLVDDRSIRGIQLTGGLVGEEEPGAVSNGSADSDPLLLAPRELAWMGVAPVEETDALQQLVRAPVPPRGGVASEPELEPHELSGRQLASQGSRVVLVGIAE